MAKEEVTKITVMTKKAKLLNFLKIFGICCGGMLALIAGVVIYVWATGGFKPAYVALTQIGFSSDQNTSTLYSTDSNGNAEYIIDGGSIDEDNPVYQTIRIVANDDCTELDGIITISSSSSDSLVVQLVEDDNTTAVKSNTQTGSGASSQKNADSQTNTVYYDKYNVKFGTDIKIVPITKTITVNGKEITYNVGGWVKLTVTGNSENKETSLISSDCYIFVDSPVQSFDIETKDSYESEEVAKTQTKDAYTRYKIYASTALKLDAINFFPSNSLNVPTGIKPNGKGTSSFSLSKKVIYQVSDTQIASVDANGNVTVVKGKEGSEFSVTAYVVPKYVNLDNMPSLEAMIALYGPNDGPIEYNKALAKVVCYASNTLHFYVVEPSVDSISTGTTASSETASVHNYQVLKDDNDLISFGNDTTKIAKNYYYIDMIFTDTVDDTYKTALFNKIKLYSVYAVDSSVTTDVIVANGKNFVISDTYIKIELNKSNGAWYLSALQYTTKDNYILFAYPKSQNEDGSTNYAYAYQKISLSKVEVDSISLSKKSIDLTYQQGQAVEPSISIADIATVSPSNATYQTLRYFVPNDCSIVETYSGVSISLNNVLYYAVGRVSGDDFDWTTLYAKNSGSVNMIAVVLKTDIDGNFLEDNGTLLVEAVSDNITINVSELLNLSTLRVSDATISNLMEVSYVSGDDTKSVSNITVYKDKTFDFVLTYTGTHIDFSQSGIQLLFEGKTTSPYMSINAVETALNDNKYIISVQATGEGTVVFNVKYDSTDISVTVNVYSNEVDTFELQNNGAVATSANVDTVFLTKAYNEFDSTNIVYYELVDGVYKIVEVPDKNSLANYYEKASATASATAYTWDLTKINMSVIQKHGTNEIKDEELKSSFYYQTYAWIDDFDTLSGTNLENALQSLVEDNSIIAISSDNVWAIKNTGKVIVRAIQRNGSIKSNALIVYINRPIITQVGAASSLTAVSFGGATSVDGKITKATGLQFSNLPNFECGDIDVSSLIKYKFSDQIEYNVNDNTLYQSNVSYATIDNASRRITYANLSNNEVNEKLTAYIDVIFADVEFFTLTLQADYKYTKNLDTTYETPSLVDLFTNNNGDPAVLFVDRKYSSKVASTNKLYVLNEFKDITTLKKVYTNAFLAYFYYADVTGGTAYYHIYNILSFVSLSNCAYDSNAKQLKLLYNSSPANLNVSLKMASSSTDGSGIINVFTLKTTPAIQLDISYVGTKSTVSGNNYDNIGVSSLQYTGSPASSTINLTSADSNGVFEFEAQSTTTPTVSGNIQAISLTSSGYGVSTAEKFFVSAENDTITYSRYLLTNDTARVSGKKYYKLTIETDYYEIFSPDVSYLPYTYEKNGNDYFLTTDTTITSGKNYYYKTNYREATETEMDDVTTLYELATITISNVSGYYQLSLSDSIKCLYDETISMTLKIKYQVLRTYTIDGTDYPITNTAYEYYNINFTA